VYGRKGVWDGGWGRAVLALAGIVASGRIILAVAYALAGTACVIAHSIFSLLEIADNTIAGVDQAVLGSTGSDHGERRGKDEDNE
jgi:hypothetical protein